MAAIISFIVIAIIAIVVLTMINVNAVSSEKTIKGARESIEVDSQNNNKVKTLEPADPIKLEEKKSENAENETSDKMNDQAYRKALQSFTETNKNNNVNQVEKKINDDEFRKALQSMSGKNNHLDKKD